MTILEVNRQPLCRFPQTVMLCSSTISSKIVLSVLFIDNRTTTAHTGTSNAVGANGAANVDRDMHGTL